MAHRWQANVDASFQKRKAARRRWERIRRFIQNDWSNPRTPKEEALWRDENRKYHTAIAEHSELMNQRRRRRRYHEEILSQDANGANEEDRMLARMYQAFWKRASVQMDRRLSFARVVDAALEQDHHLHHHTGLNRALGETRQSSFSFDYRKPVGYETVESTREDQQLHHRPSLDMLTEVTIPMYNPASEAANSEARISGEARGCEPRPLGHGMAPRGSSSQQTHRLSLGGVHAPRFTNSQV